MTENRLNIDVLPIKLNNQWQINMLHFLFQCLRNAKDARLADMVQFILCEGGLGSGKTFICAYIFILLLFVFPGNLGLAGAATYPGVKDILIPQILEILPPETIAKYERTHPQNIYLKNGSQIRFRQLAEAPKVKGPQYGVMLVEEASNISEPVNNMLLGRLRQPGIPLRCLLYATNPEEDSPVAKLFDLQKDNPFFRSYISQTKDNKDNLPVNYEENLRLTYDENLQLKYLDGKRVKSLGKAFPEFSKKTHGFGPDNVLGIKKAPESFDYVIAGADNGHATPGSIAVIGVKDKTYWLVDLVYTPGQNETWWVAEAVRLHDKWGYTTLWVDCANPDRIAAYKEAKLDARPSLKDKGSVQGRLGMLLILIHVRPDTGYPRFYYDIDKCAIFGEEAMGLRKKKMPGTENNYTEELDRRCPNHAIDAGTYAIYGDWKEETPDWSITESYKPKSVIRDSAAAYMGGGNRAPGITNHLGNF
jgi:hypothetical protein